MRLYIAGLFTSHFHLKGNLFSRAPEAAQKLRASVTHKLESYHYIHKGNYLRHIREDGEKLFLDSGAFSSFSLGVEVSIEAYAEWVKENQDVIEMASVLDAIGDPVGTFHNQNTLEKLGVQVLPCFHYGEPLDLCEYYVRNYEYITLGGMVPIPNNKLKVWLDEVWDKVLTDKDGYSRIKIHGFGLTSRELMDRYPWYSCDSSSWVQAAANGSIVFPEIDRPISISARSPNVRKFGAHFDTMPSGAKDRVLGLLHKYGLTLEDVRDDYKARWALNAYTFDQLGKLMGDDHWRRPFYAKQPGLF